MADRETPVVEKWVGADEVAAHLGFKPDHVRKLARMKLIPAFATPQNPEKKDTKRKRQNWRFKLSQVDAAMEEQAKAS